jgi:poly(3-hydroxybutyrate) depolymerase
MFILKFLTSLSISLTLVFSFLSQPVSAQFVELTDFSENPGHLTASYFSPKMAKPRIVFLLHGCAQTGEN